MLLQIFELKGCDTHGDLKERFLGRNIPIKLFVFLFIAAVIVTCVLLSSSLLGNSDPENLSEDQAYLEAVEAYQKEWNVNISACKEVFFASSDHRAFGEGFRYAVLEGTAAFLDLPVNGKGADITQMFGNEASSDAGYFLEDVFTALDVPNEYRLALPKCEWVLYEQSDGSKLLLAKLDEENLIYLAEQLL